MPPESDLHRVIEHLGSQFERGLPMLLLGAGFSLGAMNISRTANLPTVEDLKRDLWNLCFPGEDYSSSTSLQNLYESALRLRGRDTADMLRARLTVDSETLPDWYEAYFGMPWARIYTLNVDDLPRSAARRFGLPRPLHVVSALREQYEPPPPGKPALDVVHLNGDIDGIPNEITFSTTQYAERLARPEPWYVRLVADLVSRPFVFVGTQLEEPSLWQHIELRRSRGGRGTRELRPKSYIVVPALDAARRSLLAEYNVAWLPMDAATFQLDVLSKLGAARQTGLRLLERQTAANPFELRSIPLVSALSNTPAQSSQFLIGEAPNWTDIHGGRAVRRASDEDLWPGVQHMLTSPAAKGVVVVTGTAGSGKSTALMRVALRMNADGTAVGWVDSEGSLSPHEIRSGMRAGDAPSVLCIDDADMYGSELSSMVRELCLRPPHPLIIVAVRSGRIDLVLHEKLIQEIPFREFAMPPLADNDIDALIDVLALENRLGILLGKSRDEQRAAFRDQAGRQLLVAMIQATSGRRFEEKAVDELTELGADGRVYGIIAVASAYRFGLQRNEILLGLGESTNAVLNTVDMLIRRHIVRVGHDGSIWARHRVIAEVIRDELQKSGAIKELLQGLAHVGATQVNPNLSRSARPWRLLRHVINHDFLIRVIGPDPGRELYGEIENLLRWDYHFWLQRGSLEVEVGDLDLAENFLNQARALSPTDFYVQTEYSYLLFRKAIDNPTAMLAPAFAREATETLEGLIERNGERDVYAFHVLGSQGLSWARRGIPSSIEKEQFLREIMLHLQSGCRLHPRAVELKKLMDDVRQEHLSIAVPSQRTLIRP